MKFDVTVNAKEVAERMIARKTRITEVLAKAIGTADTMLAAYIVDDKLDGQLLKRREGNLARSIRTQEVTVSGSRVSGGVLGGGPIAPWAKWQEKGTTPGEPWIIEAKNAKALAFMPLSENAIVPMNKQMVLGVMKGIKEGARNMASSRQKFSKLGGVIVKAVLHPPLEAKNFMSGSLAEKREEIVTDIANALNEAVKS